MSLEVRVDVHMCDVCLWRLGWMCIRVQVPWRSEAIDSLVLELQAGVSHQMWVLGTKLGSSAGALSVLKNEFSPQHLPFFIDSFLIGV